MHCRDLQRRLEAHLDGTLGHAQQEALRRHLRRCPRCRAEIEAIHRFEDELAAAFADGPASARLWERIELDAGPAEDDRAPPQPKPQPQPQARRPAPPRRAPAGHAAASPPRQPPRVATSAARRRWPAVGLALALLAVFGGSLVDWGRAPDPEAERVLLGPMLEFGVFRDSGRALDLATGDPWRLHAWLARRVAFDLPEPALVPGFDLVGGRLSHLLDRRAVAYAYRADGRDVALYVMPREGLAMPPLAPRDGLEAALHEQGGITHLLLERDGLAFSLVAGLPAARLMPLAEAASLAPLRR